MANFSFDKNQLYKLDLIEKAALALEAELQTQIDVFNANVAALKATVQDVVDNYNVQITNFTELIEEVLEEAQEQYEEKSERWQEGDRGQTVSDWIDKLRDLATTEEVELPETEELTFDAVITPLFTDMEIKAE